MVTPSRRLLMLTEGQLNVYDAKMAVAVIRYRPQEAAAVLDSTRAGERLEQVIGVGKLLDQLESSL